MAIFIDTQPARANTSWRSTAELTTNVKIAVVKTSFNYCSSGGDQNSVIPVVRGVPE